MTYPVVWKGRPGYPALLAELYDPPARLYVRGERADVLERPSVAIVGARSCSAYGAHVARELARELAAAGVVVVSGLARGVDGEAHRGALAAGGLTVAVLGCGIDRDYPRAHADLAGRIAETGAIVSEYPPGVEPSPWRFPARNRRPPAAMRNPLNHAIRPRRLRRRTPCACGPGVVSQPSCSSPRSRSPRPRLPQPSNRTCSSSSPTTSARTRSL